MSRRSKKSELIKFGASTAEEIDALRVDMEPDPDDLRDPDDGTGILGDEVARERIEGLTEVGPDISDRGVESVAPGWEDSSSILRKHRRRRKGPGATDDGILDEPRDEPIIERRLDQGTAA